MKCPRCWAEKAYQRPVEGWKEFLLSLFWFEPIKCHHCFHKFTVHRIFTLGKSLRPPAPQGAATERPARHSHAGRHGPPARSGTYDDERSLIA